MATGLRAVMAAQAAACDRDAFLQVQASRLETAIGYCRDRWLLTQPRGEGLRADLQKFDGKPGSAEKSAAQKVGWAPWRGLGFLLRRSRWDRGARLDVLERGSSVVCSP